MGVNDLKAGRIDVDGNPVHKVQDTLVGRDIFRIVKKVIDMEKEATGQSRLDWGKVFLEMLYEYFYKLEDTGYDDFLDALSPAEKRLLVQSFLKELDAVKMDDTLFEDVKTGEGLERLSRVAGEIDIWTAGDIVNGHQSAKLVSAEIYRLVHRALSGVNMPVRRNDIVSDEKASRVPDALDYFVKNNGAGEVIVAVFDDKPSVLKRADAEIRGWKEKKVKENNNIKVHPLYIRSVRGRHGKESWPEDYDLEKIEATDLFGVAERIEKEAVGYQIPRENVIAFLDFDGTLSDNRILRLRQTHVMYTHIMKAVKAAIVKYLAEKHGCRIDDKNDVSVLIKEHRDDVWDIYDLLVRPPHHRLNRVLAEISRQKGGSLDRPTIEALYEVDAYLQSSKWMNPGFTAKHVRSEFLSAVTEYAGENRKGMPSWLFDGDARFINREYYHNEQRKGEDGNEKRIVRLLMDDRERERALELAGQFEQCLRSSWRDQILSGWLSFQSGGLKSKTELVNKIAAAMEKRDDWEAVMLFHDLVRGKVVVNNNYPWSSAYEDLDALVGSFLISPGKKDIVAFNNYYLGPYNTGEDGGWKNPLLGFKMVIRLAEDVHYELQMVTRLADAVGRLNHDTVFKPLVALSASQRDYIMKMSWCAHLMDLEEAVLVRENNEKLQEEMDERALWRDEEFRCGR